MASHWATNVLMKRCRISSSPCGRAFVLPDGRGRASRRPRRCVAPGRPIDEGSHVAGQRSRIEGLGQHSGRTERRHALDLVFRGLRREEDYGDQGGRGFQPERR